MAHATVLAAGADPAVAERLSYKPYPSLEDALQEARRRAGTRTALVTAPPLFAAVPSEKAG